MTYSSRWYLQWLANKYGDFNVTHSFKKDGEIIWCKHRSVLELWHSDKGLYFLSKANHRQIMPNEVILDIDDNATPHNLWRICWSLTKRGFKFRAYHTGSRGYHIHVNLERLKYLRRYERQQERMKLIYQYDCEMLKASDKTMIAIENQNHFKSGKPKIEVEWRK